MNNSPWKHPMKYCPWIPFANSLVHFAINNALLITFTSLCIHFKNFSQVNNWQFNVYYWIKRKFEKTLQKKNYKFITTYREDRCAREFPINWRDAAPPYVACAQLCHASHSHSQKFQLSPVKEREKWLMI